MPAYAESQAQIAYLTAEALRSAGLARVIAEIRQKVRV